MRFKIAIWNGGIPPTLMKTIQTAYGKSLLIGDLDSDNKANHWVQYGVKCSSTVSN